MARRKKQRDLCELSKEEYDELKRETDVRITSDYAPGNIVEARGYGYQVADGTLGICYLDHFFSVPTAQLYVTRWAVFADGRRAQLGYSTLDKIVPTGSSENVDEWCAKNCVVEVTKRKKRNS